MGIHHEQSIVDVQEQFSLELMSYCVLGLGNHAVEGGHKPPVNESQRPP
jgi:hypothetical protein